MKKPSPNKKTKMQSAVDSAENKMRLVHMGENIEDKSHRFMVKLSVRLVTGFIHFKKRKGEILAGGTTFFGVLSFGPILLLMISLVGWSGLNEIEAKDYVLNVIKLNFPEVATAVLADIEKVISARLKTGFASNFIHLFFLMYSTMGIIGSIMFGMHAIAEQESRGGFLLEDFKSIMIGVFGSIFIFSLLFYGQYGPIIAKKITEQGPFYDFARSLLKGNTVPITMSLVFFTFFYQFASTNIVKLKDSFLGAVTFVACFSLGKSFYWVYLQMSKDSINESYGSFSTLFVAIFWVYYLMCAFFYGASVAFCQYEAMEKKIASPPPIDQIPGKSKNKVA